MYYKKRKLKSLIAVVIGNAFLQVVAILNNLGTVDHLEERDKVQSLRTLCLVQAWKMPRKLVPFLAIDSHVLIIQNGHHL